MTENTSQFNKDFNKLSFLFSPFCDWYGIYARFARRARTVPPGHVPPPPEMSWLI